MSRRRPASEFAIRAAGALGLLLTVCVASLVRAEVESVESIYQINCAQCHGGTLEGTAQGPSLVALPLQHGATLSQLRASILDGFDGKGMPGWRGLLADTDVDRLAMLIRERQSGFRYDSVDPGDGELQLPSEPLGTQHGPLRVEAIVGDLYFPFSIAPLPDGSILVTEKTLGLSVVSPDGRRSRPVEGTPQTASDAYYRGAALLGKGWLLEVAVHPDYTENGWIYLSYGDQCDGCNVLSRERGEPVTMLAIVRGRIEEGRWVDQELIWKSDVDAYLTGHNQALGGRLVFDADGYLFFSVGGISQESGIQDLDRPYGKIHRLHDDGRVPSSNPFVGIDGAIGSIWSLGHRNPQGLATDRSGRVIWATEHGPRGGDELNLIEPGKNYGWPMVSEGMWYDGRPIRFAEALGISYDPGALTPPVTVWTPSIGISSLLIYEGAPFPEWQGSLLVSSLRGESLERLVIRDGRVEHAEMILDDFARIRDVELAADGSVLLLVEVLRRRPPERGSREGSHVVRLVPASVPGPLAAP